jgi:hypothetical protein
MAATPPTDLALARSMGQRYAFARGDNDPDFRVDELLDHKRGHRDDAGNGHHREYLAEA